MIIKHQNVHLKGASNSVPYVPIMMLIFEHFYFPSLVAASKHVSCFILMRVSYIGEMSLNVRPQQTVAPGDHHPVGGELEGAGRVEEEVGSLLEHQPEALHSPVLLGSKQSPSPPRLSM